MSSKILSSRDDAAPSRTPMPARERLAEIERIIERRLARRRQEQRDQTARLRVLLDEGGR